MDEESEGKETYKLEEDPWDLLTNHNERTYVDPNSNCKRKKKIETLREFEWLGKWWY